MSIDLRREEDLVSFYEAREYGTESVTSCLGNKLLLDFLDLWDNPVCGRIKGELDGQHRYEVDGRVNFVFVRLMTTSLYRIDRLTFLGC
jgi:hypothetical protein